MHGQKSDSVKDFIAYELINSIIILKIYFKHRKRNANDNFVSSYIYGKQYLLMYEIKYHFWTNSKSKVQQDYYMEDF